MCLYQVHVLGQGQVSFQHFLFILQSILCFYDFMFLCFYVSLFPSIQKTLIQKLHRLYKFLCFMSYDFNMCHIFISCISFVFYILGLFLSSDFFVFCFCANWLGGTSHEAPLNKSVKLLQQELIHPSLGCMPFNHSRWKFNFDDYIIIVSKAASRKINFVLQHMGAGSISQKMLKNSHVYKKTKINV
jgi:hypothetical protein